MWGHGGASGSGAVLLRRSCRGMLQRQLLPTWLMHGCWSVVVELSPDGLLMCKVVLTAATAAWPCFMLPYTRTNIGCGRCCCQQCWPVVPEVL
jgi:hypothetical protein